MKRLCRCFPGFRGKPGGCLAARKGFPTRGPLEAFGGAGDDLVLDAERQAEVAGAAETGTGHGEDAFVKELVDEGHVVAAGSLREEIKRAFGHLEFIARVGEDVAHHFAAAGINVHVHLRSERAVMICWPTTGGFTKPRIRLASVRPP